MTNLDKGDRPVRLSNVIGFQAADDGDAFLIAFETANGPLTLELPTDGLKWVLMGLLQASVACAERRTDLKPIGETDASLGLYLPASDVQVSDVSQGKRVAIRVGVIDLSVMIDSPQTATALGEALLG